jgi:signal transduction histidine kinase
VDNRRRLFRALVWTIGGSLVATVVFTNTPWRGIPWQTFTTMLFAGPCVVLCVYGLPIVAPFARRRLPFPLDWLAIITATLIFGGAGSLIGAAATLAVGAAGPGQTFHSWYPQALKISLYFTLIFGLSGTMVQELRARLASTTVALRTKERDEADARRLAAEAQLASLEARVDPHFLFNTLNSIAALVRDKPAEAERVIEQLAALMRSSLDRRVSLVPLEEELAVVTSYLDIERVRFGDRLRFAVAPAVDAARALVPRLSLQTLAENSVKFAVAASREGASITVHAAAHDGRLRVSVEDDGPGFDVSRLPDGHGLQLLKSRLLMTFGDRASLVATSRPGCTVMALDLPFETVIPRAPTESLPPLPKVDRC